MGFSFVSWIVMMSIVDQSSVPSPALIFTLITDVLM